MCQWSGGRVEGTIEESNEAMLRFGLACEARRAPREERLAVGSRQPCFRQMQKTKLCQFHLEGKCKYGSDCAFAHDSSEVRDVPDLRKTRLCRAFSKGRCTDEDCNFAHGEDDLRKTDFCYKKTFKLCMWFDKGKCINGEQCRFAHGLDELKANGGDPNAQYDLEEPPDTRRRKVSGEKRSHRGRKRRRGGVDGRSDDGHSSPCEDVSVLSEVTGCGPLCDRCFSTVAMDLGFTVCAVCRNPRLLNV